MPLWLGGTTWIVATGWGIARWDGTKYDIHRFPRAGQQDPPELELFAVLDDDGRTALFRRAGEGLARWQIGEGGAEVVPCAGAAPLAAIATGGGQLVAVVADGTRAVLRRARVDGDRVVLGDKIALPPAKRVPIRDVLFQASDKLFPEDRVQAGDPPFEPDSLDVLGGGDPAEVRLTESPHGIAVSSTYGGVVAVLDRDKLAPRFAVRVPALPPPYRILALPVPQGVLVTMVVNDRHTGYVLLDPRGEVLASCATLGKEPAWQAETEGVFCGETVEIASKDRLWTLALPTLRPRKHPGGGDAYPIAHAVTADGARLVAYTAHNHEKPHNWRLVHTPGGGGRRRGREVSMPDFRPPPEPATPAQPARVVGPAALGLVADNVPWQVAVGAETELRLDLSNRGGPVRGIFVELTGETIGKTIAPIEIAAGDQVAPFAGTRAELAALAIDPGYVEPTGKRPRQAPPLPPPPSVSLVIRVRGAGAGSGLLMVRIGALAGGASAMQGRGITVS